MSRIVLRASQLVVDLFVLSVAYWLAFLFRFEFDITLTSAKLLFFTWPYVILLQYIVLAAFRVPSFAWRYISIREASRILAAMGVSVGILVLMRLTLASPQGYSRFVVLPLGVLAMDFVLGFLGVTGVRVLRRMTTEHQRQRQRQSGADAVPTLLVGAGHAGVLVARELSSRPDIGMRAVGFADDDPLKIGTVIHGVRVLGPTTDIPALVAKTGARQALITVAGANGKLVRRTTVLCDEADIPVKIIPGLFEILDGQVNLSRIRDVAIEDLLRRDPVQLDEAAVGDNVRDRTVLVTGAGGSIGSELCRQIVRFDPASLVLVEQAENALFHVHRELVSTHDEANVTPCVADVCDKQRMQELFVRHRPDVVFHAAAHKHVPMMEWNPGEAIKNNILGTRVLADLSDEHGVGEFVMISTDKAVNPTSVMGATKRIAEMYIQAISQTSESAFVAVRFGNVLGSAGSVVPIFNAQIADGGPVTVTHPDMRRYFMTIPEACQLVLQAAAMGEGGEIFILDMGDPVKIVDLATDLIRLSGLRPGEDIEIEFTGLRPGEKMFEELSVADEQADKTHHPKVFVGRILPEDRSKLEQRIEELATVADCGSPERVREALAQAIPEYRTPAGTADTGAPVDDPAAEPATPASLPHQQVN